MYRFQGGLVQAKVSVKNQRSFLLFDNPALQPSSLSKPCSHIAYYKEKNIHLTSGSGYLSAEEAEAFCKDKKKA